MGLGSGVRESGINKQHSESTPTYIWGRPGSMFSYPDPAWSPLPAARRPLSARRPPAVRAPCARWPPAGCPLAAAGRAPAAGFGSMGPMGWMGHIGSQGPMGPYGPIGP